MLAYTYIEKGKFQLTQKPKPVLQGERDAVVRVTLSSICTSDLHIRHGSVPRAVPGITVGHEMVGVVESVGAEVTDLKPGDRATVEELLYGLLLCSGNDAALALADHCGGLERFVAEMNRKAAELGMTGTSFANPNGLDQEGHYSTARDMARLAACAVKNETLVRLCSTRSVTVGGRTMTNHNRLLRSIDGCIGLKTGYTRAAGRTLVSCVRRNGRTLVAVTLQDGNDWADHAALYEFGFGP